MAVVEESAFYGDALEEPTVVLAYGNELLGPWGKLGELQNLSFGERRYGKAGPSGGQGIHDLRVLFIKHRAGGIDKLTAGSHARARLPLSIVNVSLGSSIVTSFSGQTPRNLGMTAHGASTRARRIDKDRVEQGGLAKHRVKRWEYLIELAGIARHRTNTPEIPALCRRARF